MSKCSLHTIKQSEVPEYLHMSELYLSLSPEEDEDGISIPSNCMKQDLLIDSAGDFEHVLLTMRFWILSQFPTEVICMLVTACNSEYRKVLQKYKTEFPSVPQLIEALEINDKSQHLQLACQFGRIDFVDYFIAQGASLKTFYLQFASDNGHLDCLRHLYQLLSASHSVHIQGCFLQSAMYKGQVECLRFYIDDCNASWGKRLCYLAAMHSQFPCLQLLVNRLLSKGESISSAIWRDVMRGKKENSELCLKFLLDNVPVDRSQLNLALIACEADNVNVLQVLVREGFLMNSDLIDTAAKAVSLDCLTYLHKELHYDCWVPSTMTAAAGAGHLDLVKQLHEQGCPWDESAVIAARSHCREKCMVYLLQHGDFPLSEVFWTTPSDIHCRLAALEFSVLELSSAFDVDC